MFLKQCKKDVIFLVYLFGKPFDGSGAILTCEFEFDCWAFVVSKNYFQQYYLLQDSLCPILFLAI